MMSISKEKYLREISLTIIILVSIAGCTSTSGKQNNQVQNVKSEILSTPSKVGNKYPITFLTNSLKRTSGQQHVTLSNFPPIILDIDQIDVSSHFQNYTKDNLLTDKGFWHIQIPKTGNKSWITIDLRSETQLAAISIRPRNGYLSQLWKGGAAVLEGSNNGGNWTSMVVLVLDQEVLNQTDWISYILPANMLAYRYYRILINSSDFLAMDRFELYTTSGKEKPKIPSTYGQQNITLSNFHPIVLDVDQIEVSSHFQNYTKDNLLNDKDFWHIQIPKTSNKSWITIDLRSETQLAAISIRPRNGYSSQLWRGGAAVLEGGNDGGNWTSIASLVLDQEVLNQTDWISFILPEDIPAYHRFRIVIDSPDFLSLSGLKLCKSTE